MFTYFRGIKIAILALLLSTGPLYADVSGVDGPDDLFGGAAGCTTDCDFDSINTGFLNASSINTERIDATTGAFTNISGTNGYFSTFLNAAGVQLTQSSGGLITGVLNNMTMRSGAANKTLNLEGWGRTTAGDSVKIVPSLITSISNSSGIVNGVSIPMSLTQTGTAGYNVIFIDLTTVSEGTGEKNYIKATGGSSDFRVDSDGHAEMTGLQVAYRNISSTTETITTADHTIFCLPNDNSVTLNLPTAVQADSSSVYEIKYVDPGSTNKCYVEGDGAETTEGFLTYSALDTYRECAKFQSDGSNWWKTGGCP